MKNRVLYFVVGEAPTPEETAAILKLAEPTVIPAQGIEGEPGYQPEQSISDDVEVISVQKLDADKPIDLAHVTALAGAVPTHYADAFKAASESSGPAAAWTPSDTERPAGAKRRK